MPRINRRGNSICLYFDKTQGFYDEIIITLVSRKSSYFFFFFNCDIHHVETLLSIYRDL